jgi:F-type H+-transporting ATPase subunit delta
MAELTVDVVYGTSLFDVSLEMNKTLDVLKDFDFFMKSLTEQPMFYEFLCTPTIPKNEKKDVVKNCFDGLICQELLNFIYILIDKKRCRNIKMIFNYFHKLIDKNQNVSNGIVFSFEELSLEEIASIENETGKLLRKKINLKNEIDKSIIGGFKILIEGKVIDASVKKRLIDLKDSLIHMEI